MGSQPGEMMSFCVNRHSADGHGTPSRTTIHRTECFWAQRYGDGPKWRGFPTIEEAEAWARTSGYPLNCCKQCNPL